MTKRIEASGQAHGLDWVVLALTTGHRCGYVRVPDDHPWFGKDSSDQVPGPAVLADRTVDGGVMGGMLAVLSDSVDEWLQRIAGRLEVHGGITYAGARPSDDSGEGWWFGFDCAHTNDAKDLSLIDDPVLRGIYGRPSSSGEVVRTAEFAQTECESLAAQLAAVSETRDGCFDQPKGQGEV